MFPLIDESEKLEYKNLVEGINSIEREFPLPEYQVSILHGQMKAEDKEYEMKRFVEGVTNIMVSTTVIEVGVNVPNASVMIIEKERFGLSTAPAKRKSWKRCRTVLLYFDEWK